MKGCRIECEVHEWLHRRIATRFLWSCELAVIIVVIVWNMIWNMMWNMIGPEGIPRQCGLHSMPVEDNWLFRPQLQGFLDGVAACEAGTWAMLSSFGHCIFSKSEPTMFLISSDPLSSYPFRLWCMSPLLSFCRNLLVYFNVSTEAWS